MQNDTHERVGQHEREANATPVNIQHANPAEVRLEVRDLGDIKLAYSNGLYDLQAHTGEPTYVLFGGWQTEQRLGFVATVHTNGETDTRMSTENREGRDIQTELHHRIEQVIERSHNQAASPTHEPSSPEADREPQPDQPDQLEPADRTHDRTPDQEPDRTPEPEPGREPVEQRDPYIEQAIQREQERQQAWENGIDQDRDIDRGFGIEWPPFSARAEEQTARYGNRNHAEVVANDRDHTPAANRLEGTRGQVIARTLAARLGCLWLTTS